MSIATDTLTARNLDRSMVARLTRGMSSEDKATFLRCHTNFPRPVLHLTSIGQTDYWTVESLTRDGEQHRVTRTWNRDGSSTWTCAGCPAGVKGSTCWGCHYCRESSAMGVFEVEQPVNPYTAMDDDTFMGLVPESASFEDYQEMNQTGRVA